MEKPKIKDLQKEHIYEYIRTQPNLSRKHIAIQLKLRPIDVSRYVNELIFDDLVCEHRHEKMHKRGRPELLLSANFQSFSAIAITIVSRKIKGCVIDMAGNTITETAKYVQEKDSSDRIYETIVLIINELIASLKETSFEKSLCGIGLSLSGLVDTTNNIWIRTTRWPSIKNMNLHNLENIYRLPVHIVRNISAKLSYLLHVNPAFSSGGTLLIHWGWAVKAAFSFAGSPIESVSGNFGEIGHWVFDKHSTKICSCGRKGCLETEAALWYLLDYFKTIFPETPSEESEFADFFKAIPFESIEDLILPARDAIAVTMTNLYYTFRPEHIIVYGPFTDRDEVYFPLMKDFAAYTGSNEVVNQVERLNSHFQGDSLGSTFEFFSSALKTKLRSHT